MFIYGHGQAIKSKSKNQLLSAAALSCFHQKLIISDPGAIFTCISHSSAFILHLKRDWSQLLLLPSSPGALQVWLFKSTRQLPVTSVSRCKLYNSSGRASAAREHYVL